MASCLLIVMFLAKKSKNRNKCTQCDCYKIIFTLLLFNIYQTDNQLYYFALYSPILFPKISTSFCRILNLCTICTNDVKLVIATSHAVPKIVVLLTQSICVHNWARIQLNKVKWMSMRFHVGPFKGVNAGRQTWISRKSFISNKLGE